MFLTVVCASYAQRTHQTDHVCTRHASKHQGYPSGLMYVIKWNASPFVADPPEFDDPNEKDNDTEMIYIMCVFLSLFFSFLAALFPNMHISCPLHIHTPFLHCLPCTLDHATYFYGLSIIATLTKYQTLLRTQEARQRARLLDGNILVPGANQHSRT
jgi:hypothetical protein